MHVIIFFYSTDPNKIFPIKDIYTCYSCDIAHIYIYIYISVASGDFFNRVC